MMWKEIRHGWAWIEWENTEEKDKPHILLHLSSAYHKSFIAHCRVIVKEKNGKEYIVEEFDDIQKASKKIEELKKVL